ncbi:MAG: D-alanine--D-alanine ligase [Coriobacteriia bacterium]
MPITPEDIRVAVLMGGRSAEREVSLRSGEQVSSALKKAGFDVVEVDAGEDDFVVTLASLEANVVFICLHGRFGEDGTVQGLCELLELPYVGSGVLASALAMDKVKSKQIFEQAGIATPDYVVLRRGELYDVGSIVEALGEKTVVKPANEGSSVGMTIVHSAGELAEAIEKAFRHDRYVLVERFVGGTEVTVGVLGNDEVVALPTLEIVPEHEFYDYESKYIPGMSRHIIPARARQSTCEECQRLAVAAHKVLGCRGISRADTIIAEDGTVWLLEVNTIPGMTQTSLVPDAARAAGIEFPELCRMLVEFALEPKR